jgi:hypothetical protein
VAREHGDEVAALVEELLPIATAYVDGVPDPEAQPEAACSSGQQGPGQGSGGVGSGASSAAAAGLHPRWSSEDVCAALLAYSASIHAAVPSVEMALREFRWRNGFFLEQGGAAGNARHLGWLRRAGAPAELYGSCG